MIFIIVSIALSSAAYIYGDLFKKPILKYIFKPLSTVLVIFLAFQQSVEISETYKYFIISGLIFSLFGDIFLMLPKDKFIQGLASFLIAHIIFVFALADEMGFYTNILSLVPAAIYTAIFLWVLLPKTGKMKIPVLVYALVLMVFLWQATGRLYYSAEISAWYSFLGALLFVISDSFLAYAKFIKQSRYSTLFIHITYWSALVYIVLSV